MPSAPHATGGPRTSDPLFTHTLDQASDLLAIVGRGRSEADVFAERVAGERREPLLLIEEAQVSVRVGEVRAAAGDRVLEVVSSGLAIAGLEQALSQVVVGGRVARVPGEDEMVALMRLAQKHLRPDNSCVFSTPGNSGANSKGTGTCSSVSKTMLMP